MAETPAHGQQEPTRVIVDGLNVQAGTTGVHVGHVDAGRLHVGDTVIGTFDARRDGPGTARHEDNEFYGDGDVGENVTGDTVFVGSVTVGDARGGQDRAPVDTSGGARPETTRRAARHRAAGPVGSAAVGGARDYDPNGAKAAFIDHASALDGLRDDPEI